MLNIAIVEDDEKDVEALKTALARYEKETGEIFDVSRFERGEDFLENYKPQYDLIFMDIELKAYGDVHGMNGIATAERLREVDGNVKLIFITNMAQYAIKGYSVNALDYFVKPFNYYDLKLRLDRIRRILGGEKRSIAIEIKYGTVALNIDDIYYVEIFKHTLVYHTANSDYETRGTIKDAEQQLCGYGFSRCNNSVIVNLRYCKEIIEEDVVVFGTRIRISRGRKKQFMSDFVRQFK